MSVSATIADRLLLQREAQEGKSVSVFFHARYEIRFTRNALLGNFETNRDE
jgi:hypothetical protein